MTSVKFRKNPGGKGTNQAVAAGKLGADVAMIGKVGTDEYGLELLRSLNQANVATEGILQEGTTGMAFIQVSDEGENTIVLVPGANEQLNTNEISKMSSCIAEADVIIMQLEIPLDVVMATLKLAVEHDKEVIINPAPAALLPPEMLRHVHTLIPNETELSILTGMPVSSMSEIIEAAHYLKTLGPKRLIVTLGGNGSYLINEEQAAHIPAYHVKAVDTTAAGDSFIAAFAVGKSKGLDDKEAVRFANKVAAIVVQKEGAQPSLPTLEEVDRFEVNSV